MLSDLINLGERPRDVMSQARQVFDTNLIDENSDQDQSRVFQTSKKLVMRTDELSFPDCLDKLILANDINDFCGNSCRHQPHRCG